MPQTKFKSLENCKHKLTKERNSLNYDTSFETVHMIEFTRLDQQVTQLVQCELGDRFEEGRLYFNTNVRTQSSCRLQQADTFSSLFCI